MKLKVNFSVMNQETFSLVNVNDGWCWINSKRTSLLSLGGNGSTKQTRNDAVSAATQMYKGRSKLIAECVNCDKPTVGDFCSYSCAELIA